MIRLVVFGAIAFVLGLGGSTGVLVLTAPAHSPVADSLAFARVREDSVRARHAVTPHGSTVPVPVLVAAHGDSTEIAGTAGVAAHAASAENARGPEVTTTAPAIAAGPAPAPADAPVAESFKQVGSILLNMKPADAARIVAYLNDDQVEGLLRSMTPRQAAVVLGQLPPERGAALSRRLLIPAKEVRP